MPLLPAKYDLLDNKVSTVSMSTYAKRSRIKILCSKKFHSRSSMRIEALGCLIIYKMYSESFSIFFKDR
jgi:hypothetical protein